MLPPAYPSPQLMQLGKAEALRVLHHHHRGVGNVDSHLHHRGTHQHIHCMGGKFLHNPLLVPRPHLPMEICHLYMGRQDTLELFRIIHHIFHGGAPLPGKSVLCILGSLHLRADHINLPALFHLLGNEAIRGGTIGSVHHTVLDGQTVCRELVNDRYLKISVQNEGKGSGNRRGAHHQNMGLGPFLCKPLSLPYPEAMLLVRDHQRQTVILHLLLNQGVGADYQIRLPGRDASIGLTLLPGAHGTRQKYRAKTTAVLFYIALYRLKMLQGQHLRRGHQRSLISVGCGHQKSQHCHNGLSRSHISLYQTVHAIGTAHVPPDLLPDPFLGLCQGKGEPFQEPDCIRSLLNPVFACDLTAIVLTFAHHKQKRKELVKSQPLSGLKQLFPSGREMNGLQRRPLGYESVPLQH